ncbi:caspase family protein [Variovorax sp. J22R133]|uniref:caspase family protein n=1 Tax=Variovorax brevis TaxID=3053503 RepID=UPI0025765C74|nr:caspase family protein [Variovorax sp. J22R133]MDM0116134.1 caspase family protein [Variovorax sp. J22R133]
MPRLHALLVGINDYPAEVGKLAGCLNDVDHFHDYLRSSFDASSLAVEVLKDHDATRDNIIRQFRAHLGQAGEDDVALFHYCGHGARWASAGAFREFYPDGKDEGLVCIDSRKPGGWDLADKELALLIGEVARNNPHLAVILDCCHSGSGTRGADAFRGLCPRLTYEVGTERPIDSYLDGHYAQLQRKGTSLSIPAARHILLAACERTQLAQETADRSGVFTSTLLEVLRKSGGDLSYADLFVRCRAAVRKRADNQNPQFEAAGHFNAASAFLNRSTTLAARRYSVYFDLGSWKMEGGAIHGLPTEPEKTVALALYPEDDPAQLAGVATAVQVGAQKSELQLDFTADPTRRYRAEITSLPSAPMPLYFAGTSAQASELQNAIDAIGNVPVALTDVAHAASYAIEVEPGRLMLKHRETGMAIQGVEADAARPAESAAAMAPILRHVVQWERGLALQNLRTRMDTALVDFQFAEQLADGTEHLHPSTQVTLEYAPKAGAPLQLRGKLKVRNRTAQTLHMVLSYFSAAFGIHVLRNEPVEPGEGFTTLWGDDPSDYFYLEDGVNEAIENFKLIVSTEKVDDFLLGQEALELGQVVRGTRAIGSVKPIAKMVHENEWFTRLCRIDVIRRLDQVGAADATLAKGRIKVKAHARVKADLSLSAAKSPARGMEGGPGFQQALERQGLEMLNFAATRGANESILELSNIENAAALADDPLQIELDVPLADDEAILPVVFDGRHVLLGGETFKDEQGHTQIRIDHLPETIEQRRSLGGALKLYFFKTYLKQDQVNRLRWIEYLPDGSFTYQRSGVADKVSAAKNVLLLVHGIIGDTEGMAAGVRACGLDKQFDLVLTYDYESLSTPIEETARNLKAQLAAAGLQQGDDKRLTLLVHSMGGLVSRWFIEREGGKQVVDHLVMCGTPNNGSPFGRIEDARKVINVLTGLSMNYVPSLIPFSSAVLLLLNRSRKLTPALEQMNPASDFIKTLNQSEDPGIPYSILAGDVAAYKEPSDAFFAQMLAKAGQSFLFDALFASRANDIAVGVDSILGVAGTRTITPTHKNVACHHLNYFSSGTGQQALGEVRWSG